MEPCKLTILGCGSALPKITAFHAAQLLDMGGKRFMIDCGEGVQIRMRQFAQSTTRLHHIFVSHLHGDHCLGLPGLLSTWGMAGRTASITIHAHPDIKKVLKPVIDYFCADNPFEICYEDVNPRRSEVIYEDRTLTVTSIPLLHRVPTCGFLFREKPHERHILREQIERLQIPIAQMRNIKCGADYTMPDGTLIPNAKLTSSPDPQRSYAYVSDTAYLEKIVPIIQGVDLLYHEATFLSTDTVRIEATLHSSALQAATIAQKAGVEKLVIGHYSARYKDTQPFIDEARTVFLNTFAAYDGAEFKF